MMLSPLDYFAALVQPDNTIPLFEAALSLAQDADPSLDVALVQSEVDVLADTLKKRIPADAAEIQKLRILNQYFYEELGFAGNVNDYYAPDNSYLHRVIMTRRGIPISLAVVYMEIAQQIGLEIKGISFPGHFLMKLSVPSGEIILDPFNGASLARTELEERLEPYIAQNTFQSDASFTGYLQEAPAREILVRMLRNLKALFFENKQWQNLLEIQQRLVILLPDDIRERRDRGLAYANLDCPRAAVHDLEAYLEEMPHASDAASVRASLPALKQAQNRLN